MLALKSIFFDQMKETSMNLQSMAQGAAAQLKDRKETISVAESSAGGIISAGLLSVPGASAYYAGGTVIYTKESRKIFLELPMDELKGLKPLTEEMAMVFARAVRDTMGSDWGIAELGVAGPGGTPYSKEVGISVMALAGPKEASETVITGHDDREKNMFEFSAKAFQLIERTLSS
jgi:nicotinamide-nucleotide amidase